MEEAEERTGGTGGGGGEGEDRGKNWREQGGGEGRGRGSIRYWGGGGARRGRNQSIGREGEGRSQLQTSRSKGRICTKHLTKQIIMKNYKTRSVQVRRRRRT